LASFDLLGRQTECRPLAQASETICQSLQGGAPLSTCLAQHPGCFSQLNITLVRAGERSGALGRVFTRIAQQEEQMVELLQKVRSALVMPLVITAICLGLIFLIAPLLLGSVVREMGFEFQDLPWMTKTLVVAAAILRHPLCWLLAVTSATALTISWRRQRQNPAWQLALAKFLDRIPGLGSTLRLYASLRFVRSLEMTLAVGIPLLSSLELAVAGSGHVLLQQRLPDILTAAREGHDLDEALACSKFFKPATIQSVKAGQESGSLQTSLNSLARFHQIDLDYSFETFTQALEPLVLAVVGGLVGFCVIATMLPMIQMVDRL